MHIAFKIIIIYIIIVNFITFILYYSDKKKAQKQLWRIPEATLLTASLIGGSLGAYAAMKMFRHKTKHPKFYITVPLMIIFHTVLLIFIFYNMDKYL